MGAGYPPKKRAGICQRIGTKIIHHVRDVSGRFLQICGKRMIVFGAWNGIAVHAPGDENT
jgi:hypothetical protein